MKRKTIILSAIAYLALIAVILVIGLNSKRTQLLSNKESASVSSSTPFAAVNIGQTATRTKAQTESSPQIPLVDATSGTAYPMLGDEQTSYPDAESTDLSTPITSSPTPSPQVQSGGAARSHTPTRATQQIETVQPTKTSTRTATQVPSKTPSRTPTPPPQTGWEGEWTAFWQQQDGSFLEGGLTVTRSGEAITGICDLTGGTMTMTGNVFANESMVQGDFSLNNGNGSFLWLWVDEHIFRGSVNNQFAFCASRAGSGRPDPCAYYIDL